MEDLTERSACSSRPPSGALTRQEIRRACRRIGPAHQAALAIGSRSSGSPENHGCAEKSPSSGLFWHWAPSGPFLASAGFFAPSAEGEGFEPSKRRKTLNGFRDRPVQPLRHPSKCGLQEASGGFRPT